MSAHLRGLVRGRAVHTADAAQVALQQVGHSRSQGGSCLFLVLPAAGRRAGGNGGDGGGRRCSSFRASRVERRCRDCTAMAAAHSAAPEAALRVRRLQRLHRQRETKLLTLVLLQESRVEPSRRQHSVEERGTQVSHTESAHRPRQSKHPSPARTCTARSSAASSRCPPASSAPSAAITR